MKPSYLANLLNRYLQETATEGEIWTVDQWYEARDMPRPVPPTPAELAATKARAWRRIQARTQPAAWQRPAVRWAAAALLVLGLSLGWLGGQYRPAAGLAKGPTTTTGQLTLTTEAGGWQRSTNQTGHTLPLALTDGSTVTLHPGSWLRYPARFASGHERVVELRGEAFFAVFHDASRRFRVLTPQLETTVLGTSFTVRAVPGQAEATVEVRTGAVRVSPRTTSAAAAAAVVAVVVRPNQQVVYSLAAPVLRPVLVAEPALLRPQPLRFEERPVAEVLASLQAGYGVPIRYDGAALAGCTVSLTFGTENLFGKLDLLCKALGANYECTDDTIIFRSRGCQSE